MDDYFLFMINWKMMFYGIKIKRKVQINGQILGQLMQKGIEMLLQTNRIQR